VEVEVAMLSDRAEKKWNQLDATHNGKLEGEEIYALAEWVWSSFRHGQQITSEDRDKEGEKILRRCDVNGDGSVDKAEFGAYYEKTAEAMFKFHKAHPFSPQGHRRKPPKQPTTPPRAATPRTVGYPVPAQPASPVGHDIEERTRRAVASGRISPLHADHRLTAQSFVIFHDVCGRYPTESA